MPNLFKGPLPKAALVARPRWVAEFESKNPGTHFWQFRFTEKETKMGNRVHAILPRQLIGLLEEYLREHRMHLLRGSDPMTLFVNRDGQAFTEHLMGTRVKSLTMRFAGAKMSPHVFRDAFAFEWLTTHPDDYLTVSKLLWHTNIQTTLRVYGAQFNESSAVCRLDEWLEASAAKAGSDG
jgi:integrase